MNAQQVSQAVTGTMSSSSFFASAMSVALVIIYFFLFEENKVEGWKAIIPIYSTYIKYKLFYKVSRFILFVVFVVIMIVSAACMGVVVALNQAGGGLTDAQGIFGLVVLILFFASLIGMIVISICYDISICKVYGKSGLFVFAMIFFTPICLAYLAWENRDKLRKDN